LTAFDWSRGVLLCDSFPSFSFFQTLWEGGVSVADAEGWPFWSLGSGVSWHRKMKVTAEKQGWEVQECRAVSIDFLVPVLSKVQSMHQPSSLQLFCPVSIQSSHLLLGLLWVLWNLEVSFQFRGLGEDSGVPAPEQGEKEEGRRLMENPFWRGTWEAWAAGMQQCRCRDGRCRFQSIAGTGSRSQYSPGIGGIRNKD
jgi:hypothetical protein